MVHRSGSLRARLTRRLALVLATIGVVGTIGFYVLGSRYANLAYDQALFDSVLTLADHIDAGDDGALRVNLPPAALKWLLSDGGEVIRYRITDLRNRKVVLSNGDIGLLPNDRGLVGQPAYRYYDGQDLRLRVAYTRHLVDPSDVPVLVEIGETTRKRDRLTRTILVVAALFMASTVVLAAGLVWHGVGAALAPLKLLETEAARRSGTDLQPLDPLNAPAEVRGLIQAINRLMSRVSNVMESQSHFIANAAHQLRTPLSGIRLQAQLARKDAPEPMYAALEDVENGAARASHLVDQLLVLSRAEAADPGAEGQTVNVHEVIRDVVERHLHLADERGIDLGYEGETVPMKVLGNEVLFGELLGNLVDNALRYGQAGGRVTVEARRENSDVVLAVQDDGPGFAEGERDHVFQRFYRPDSSPRGGAGLGLAIVREIVDRYGGTMELKTAPDNGSRFEIRFRATGA